MTASIAPPLGHYLTLTERRNDICTVDTLRSPSELAPQVISRETGVVEVYASAGGAKRCLELRIPEVPVPAWLIPTLQRCAPLLTLPFNWDKAGAPPVEPVAIQSAVDALWSFMSDQSALPQWTPTRTGGVQLDWHEKGIDLEMEFLRDPLDGSAVFSDNNGQEWDGPVGAHVAQLKALFRKRLLID